MQRFLIWLIALIAFFLPFEYLGSFELKEITIRPSQILAVILIIVWCFLLITKSVHYKKNYLTLPLLVFLGINFLSLIRTADPGHSIIIFFFLFFTIFLGWLITQVVKSQDDLKKIIIALALGSLVVSLFGFWQFFGDISGVSPDLTNLRPNYVKEKIGFPRIHSTAYEPLYYANYLFIPLFLFLSLWLKNKSLFFVKKGSEDHSSLTKILSRVCRGRAKGSFLVLIFFILSNLILTVARGAYLALIPALFILIYLFYPELKKPKKLIAFILLIFFAIIFNWQLIRHFDQSSYSLNQLKYEEHVINLLGGSSFKERGETMALAWRATKENPILGLGIGGFGLYAQTHLPWWQKNDWKIVNNEYLEILAESGLFGFISFIILLVVLINKSWQAIWMAKDKFIKAVLIGLFTAFIAILIQYMTFSTLYIMHVWFLIGLLVATSQMAEKNKII